MPNGVPAYMITDRMALKALLDKGFQGNGVLIKICRRLKNPSDLEGLIVKTIAEKKVKRN
jgi:hypothetical protein